MSGSNDSDDRMTFGAALALLKRGGRVRRTEWERGMFLYLVPGSTFKVSREPLLSILGEGQEVSYAQHIDISWRLPDGRLKSSVWEPAQYELLAVDWEAA